MNRKNLLIITILLLTACNQQETGSDNHASNQDTLIAGECSVVTNPFVTASEHTAKNVIFMIGDGMGLAHINAARLTAKQTGRKLSLDLFPTVGLVNTHSANELITDSAAAATALSTGHKTNNKMISLSPNGTKLKTLLQAAKEKNFATGLIATSSITHATPAAFATNVKHREQQAEIAQQLLENEIDILFGGGKAYFLPESADTSLRKDEQDLLQLAQSKNYTLIESKPALFANTSPKVLGLFADDGFVFSNDEPTLAEMTQSALKLLTNQHKNFILIIEGSQIDWAAHYNETDNTIKQTLLFDDAVTVALAFAKTNGETLLIVTADHETGGVSITKGNLDGSEVEINWASEHHTPIDVPIYSYGPQASSFTGVMDNTCIPKRIAIQLNLNLD